MSTMLLKTRKMEFYSDGRLEIYDYKLATKLNRLIKKYEGGRYRFIQGEEAIYYLHQIKTIEGLSSFLSKLSFLSKEA
jgi:hypothetical protein